MDTKDAAASAGFAFIQGAIVGAAVALLFAPRSGREFREQLRSYGRTAGQRAREMAEQGRQTARQAIEKGRRAYQSAQDEAGS